jgi:hypothetical protein
MSVIPLGELQWVEIPRRERRLEVVHPNRRAISAFSIGEDYESDRDGGAALGGKWSFEAGARDGG